MKKKIHPKYGPSTIRCSCGNVIETSSTKPEIHVEVCSACHPFYTGGEKIIDTRGRVERFKRLMKKKEAYGKKRKSNH
jgi:large subunit ribosomal protein L31